MVNPAADSGGAGEEERGRTAAELHRTLYDRAFNDPDGRDDTIAQRLDGVYQGDGDIEDVHGWYYADPRSGAFPEVDPEASQAPLGAV